MASFCSSCGQPLTSEAKFCGSCGATTSPAESNPHTVAGSQSSPRCRTCGVGSLMLQKRYRMSAPVVAIGYIILVPTVLFIIVCVFSMVEVAGLSNSDGSAFAGGILIVVAVVAFVGGLLGWLLIMKKKVLVCTHCSAVVPAS
jgi:hypothetical protein